MAQETRFDIFLLNGTFEECIIFEKDHGCGNVICCTTISLQGGQFTIGKDRLFGIVQVNG
jgi:hypothetical protein